MPGQAASMALRQKLAQIAELEQRGQFAEAIALCDQLIGGSAINPGSLPMQIFKARLQRQQGELRLAATTLKVAAGVAPESIAVLSEQGKLALASGDAEAACEKFQAVIRQRPEHAEAWFNLGHASERAQRQPAAAEAYRQALALGIRAPEEAESRLGSVLIAMGKEEEALTHFDRALVANSKDHQALYGKGMVMQAFGDFAAAEDLFLAAVEANPDFVEAFQQLAESKRFSEPNDPLAVRIRTLLDSPRSADALEKLHFALGKISNDCGEFDAAFEHFAAANRLKKARQPSFDRDALKSQIDAVISFFDHDRQASDADLAPMPVTPVFIVGMPRSGTTLVEQILSSHSQVGGAGELKFVDALSRSGIPNYPSGLAKMGADQINKIRSEYLQEIRGHVQDHRYVTDKFPGNFRHLGLISIIFPEARFVFCKRDAMDNCFSVFIQDFGAGHYYANDLDDIAFYYRCHEQVMAHWQSLFDARLLQVNYESVIEDQERETRRMLNHLGLDFEAACLAFDKNPRKIATLSRWQVRQPIYKSAAGRWRRYAKHLGLLQRALEYRD